MTKITDKKGLVKLFIVFALIVAVEIAISSAYAFLAGKLGINLPLLVVSLILYGPMIAIAFFYTKICGENLWENCKFKKIKVSTVFLSILLAIVAFPMVSFANVLSQIFVPNVMAQGSEALIDQSIILYLISLIVVAPICEEIIMRGFFHNKLKNYIPFVAAAIISGFCFGVLHLNLNQFCYAWVLGIIFAYVNRASGSIYTSIIIHMVVNAIGGIASLWSLLYLKNQGVSMGEAAEAYRTDSSMMTGSLIFLGVLSIISFFLVRIIIKAIAKRETAE